MNDRTSDASHTAADTATTRTPEELTRRSFLARLGLGGATVAVVGTGLLAYRAYDQGVYATGRGDAYAPWSDWRDEHGPKATVAAAILAANAHNAQAWQFSIHGDGLAVFSDPSRSTGTLDPFGRELDVSLGCALENLGLAAQAEGLQSVVDPPDGTPNNVATIVFSRTTPHESELYLAIPHRHSNRGAYEHRSVPAALLGSTDALVTGDVAPAELRWLSTDQERAEFGRMLVDATKAQVADRQQSLDGYRWFRSSWDAVQKYRDGLTIDGQGLSPVVRAIAKLAAAQSRTAGDSFFLSRTRDVHVATAAAYGVITVHDPQSVAQRLAGGRLLQRLHLWTTSQGLAFQHMNQIAERIDRDRQLGHELAFATPLQTLLGTSGRQALVSFRIGYPSIEALRSPRRPLSDVLQ